MSELQLTRRVDAKNPCFDGSGGHGVVECKSVIPLARADEDDSGFGTSATLTLHAMAPDTESFVTRAIQNIRVEKEAPRRIAKVISPFK
jgi:hypothetical protein